MSQTEVPNSPAGQTTAEEVLAQRLSRVRERICQDRAIIVIAVNWFLIIAFLVDMYYTNLDLLLNYRTLAPVGAVGAVMAFTLSYWFRMRESIHMTDLEQRKIAMEPDATNRQLLTFERLAYWMESTERERDGNVMLAILGTMAVVVAGAYATTAMANTTGYIALIVLLVVPVPVVWILAFFMRRKTVMQLDEEVSRLSQNPSLPDAMGIAADAGPEHAPSKPGVSGDISVQYAALKATVQNARRMLERESRRLLWMLVIFSAGVLAVALATMLNEMQGYVFPLYDYLPPLLVLAGLVPALLHYRTRLAGNLPPPATSEPENGGGQGSAFPKLTLVISGVSMSSQLMARSRRLAEGSLILAVYGAAWLEVMMFQIAYNWANQAGVLYSSCYGGMACPFPSGAEPFSSFAFFILMILPALALFLFLPYWFIGADHRLREETSIRSSIHGLTMLEREFWSRF